MSPTKSNPPPNRSAATKLLALAKAAGLLLLALAKAVGLLLLALAVAAFFTTGYWWFVTHKLLPTSRLSSTARQEAVAKQAASQPGDTNESPAVEPPPGKESSWWAQAREELAPLDERLTTPRGTFGDMFGALNAFFSALAFFCVFYAMMLQRQDLALQKKQLEDTRQVAVAAIRLQALVSDTESAFQATRLKPGEMPADLATAIGENREQIRALLSRLDHWRA
jgi:hypothetical protein